MTRDSHPIIVEAIDKAVKEVAKFDAGKCPSRPSSISFSSVSSDDWFVIAVTDANFGQYNITPEILQQAMTRQPKVNCALVCIGEGAQATWSDTFSISELIALLT